MKPVLIVSSRKLANITKQSRGRYNEFDIRTTRIQLTPIQRKAAWLLVNKSEVTTNETNQRTMRLLTDAEIQDKLAELNRTLQ
ncbi:hypothetical protein [Metabacillus halosaccharovorans]|uniref:hypothetical protein n=1 Tax=Metabacillus halosaccharovorans TaxID=930124 RepID=UPI0020423935|nr:hypothetical protein [Metabacillus halosaccharovorans]MCM3442965.1 hypothetical protein [Metabacillus halosaccharovorans]